MLNNMRRRSFGGASRPGISALLVLAMLCALWPAGAPVSAAEGDSYTVRFYSDGISADPVETQTVKEGGTAANPGAAVIDPTHIPLGFIGQYLSFLGWYEKGAPDDKPYDFRQLVTGDLDLYARFTTDLLVSYLDGNGKVFLSKRIAAGTTIPLPSEDEMRLFKAPTGEHFSAWLLNGQAYGPDEPGTYPRTARTDVTLVPKMSSASSYVFFISEGTQTPFATVVNGNPVTEPPNPERQGYDFSHWSGTEGGVPFNFTTPIASDTKLHAVWTPKKVNYTLVFWNEKPNIAGDPGTDTSNYEFYTQAVESGLAGSDAPISDAEAHALAEKHKSAAPPYSEYSYASSNAETILGNGSTVVNIYFKRIVYDFTFKLNRAGATLNMPGGPYTDANPYRYSAKFEQDISVLWPGNTLSVEKTGNEYCTGWTVPEDVKTPFVSKVLTVSRDMLPNTGRAQTVSVRWTTDAYPVSLNYMFESLQGNVGGALYKGKYYLKSELYAQDLLSAGGTPFNLKAIDGMTPLTAKALARSGNSYSAVGDKVMVEDQYLFYDRKTYSLDFNAQGGVARKNTGLDYKAIKFEANIEKYEPGSTPIRSSDGVEYSFEGWYYDADGLRPFDFKGATMSSSNLTLFAKWSSRQYTVTAYDDLTQNHPLLSYGRGRNEYVGDPSLEQEKEKQRQGQESAYSVYVEGVDYAGKGIFKGWSVYVGNGETMPLSFETPVTADMAVYAEWEPVTYRVIYEKGEGSGDLPQDNTQYSAGAQARALEAGTLASADKNFVGWLDADSGRLYNPGNLIDVNRDITLTAQFEDANNAVKLTYIDPKNTPGGDVEQYIRTGASVTLRGSSVFEAPPSEDEWWFFGWADFLANGGDGAFYSENDVLKMTGDVELYAIWVEIDYYSVRFETGAHGSFEPGTLEGA
jgi:uncharacterized repeat protein (TIGR02543 family)